MLKVENLVKKYPRNIHYALSGVFLCLEQAEWRALIGASGSGKSTLLKILACMLSADSGEIWLGTERLTNLYVNALLPGHHQIKYVAQQFDLKPHHTVRENIAYPIRRYKPDDLQNRVQTLLQLFELTEEAHRKPAELSGGQQQRVALAVAMADLPPILLLDEPFSHLDIPLRRKLYQDIKTVKDNFGTTILWVTHDIGEALAFADTISVMEQGKIIQTDTPHQLYYQPANEYIAGLLGEYNRLNGQIVRPAQIEIIPDIYGNYIVTQSHFYGIYYRIVVENIENRQIIVVYAMTNHPVGLRVNIKQKTY